MTTCVSMVCPFIPYCKEYNNNYNRANGCKTQKEIVDRALHLQQEVGLTELLGQDPREMIGKTIWALWAKDNEVEPFRVFSVEWWDDKTVSLRCISTYTGYCHTFKIGKRTLKKSVFLREEDAVKAQAERQT